MAMLRLALWLRKALVADLDVTAAVEALHEASLVLVNLSEGKHVLVALLASRLLVLVSQAANEVGQRVLFGAQVHGTVVFADRVNHIEFEKLRLSQVIGHSLEECGSPIVLFNEELELGVLTGGA